MIATVGFVAVLVLPLQIPRPLSGEEASRELHAEYRAVAREGGGRPERPRRPARPGWRRGGRAGGPRPAAAALAAGWADPVRAAARRRRPARRRPMPGSRPSWIDRPATSSSWPSGRRNRTRRGTPWPSDACAPSWSGSPTTPRRGGSWVMCRTRADGPARSRSSSSATGTSTTPSSAGSPRTGSRTSSAASCPARRRAAAGPLAPGRRGRPPTRGLESALADPHRALPDPDQRPAWPRPSASAAGSRRSTTCSWRSWPTCRATTRRWPAASATRTSWANPPGSSRTSSITSPRRTNIANYLTQRCPAGHRAEPRLLRPAQDEQRSGTGLFLPRPRRRPPRHGQPLP